MNRGEEREVQSLTNGKEKLSFERRRAKVYRGVKRGNRGEKGTGGGGGDVLKERIDQLEKANSFDESS